MDEFQVLKLEDHCPVELLSPEYRNRKYTGCLYRLFVKTASPYRLSNMDYFCT